MGIGWLVLALLIGVRRRYWVVRSDAVGSQPVTMKAQCRS
jgi:hypothetical protein